MHPVLRAQQRCLNWRVRPRSALGGFRNVIGSFGIICGYSRQWVVVIKESADTVHALSLRPGAVQYFYSMIIHFCNGGRPESSDIISPNEHLITHMRDVGISNIGSKHLTYVTPWYVIIVIAYIHLRVFLRRNYTRRARGTVINQCFRLWIIWIIRVMASNVQDSSTVTIVLVGCLFLGWDSSMFAIVVEIS